MVWKTTRKVGYGKHRFINSILLLILANIYIVHSTLRTGLATKIVRIRLNVYFARITELNDNAHFVFDWIKSTFFFYSYSNNWKISHLGYCF